jgi:hypothetical protein
MHAASCLLAAASAALALQGCAPRPSWDPRSLGDISPPTLQALVCGAAGAVELRFDEPVSLVEDTLIIDPPVASAEARSSGGTLSIGVPGQEAGREYRLEAIVEDAAGNTSALIVRFYGFNPDVPRLLINELITRGSGAHPDITELRVLADGDLAGVVLYEGTPSDWNQRFVFPACRVRAGEYVLVHWKPEGLAEERNETGARNESGGADACPTALDFWVPLGQGLSGNNGVLSLYDRPGGSIVDGVLYSNRTTESDAEYGGFGSASMQARARELVAHGGWIAGSAEVKPEDAVSPEGSTATRSIARSRSGTDTNRKEDWHITPTRGATWGTENTDDRYTAAVR